MRTILSIDGGGIKGIIPGMVLAELENRLKIRINVRFTNKKTEKDDFEKAFEFYYDYPATSQLNGALLSKALDEIFERITQDIFNESLAKW